MAFGFVWGNFRLFAVLYIPTSIHKLQDAQRLVTRILTNEEKHDVWGFGQIFAVLLLIAPLTTIIDHLEHGIRRFIPGYSAS